MPLWWEGAQPFDFLSLWDTQSSCQGRALCSHNAVSSRWTSAVLSYHHSCGWSRTRAAFPSAALSSRRSVARSCRLQSTKQHACLHQSHDNPLLEAGQRWRTQKHWLLNVVTAASSDCVSWSECWANALWVRCWWVCVCVCRVVIVVGCRMSTFLSSFRPLKVKVMILLSDSSWAVIFQKKGKKNHHISRNRNTTHWHQLGERRQSQWSTATLVNTSLRGENSGMFE